MFQSHHAGWLLSELRETLASLDLEDVEATDEVEASGRTTATLAAAIGKMQAELDEVDLGQLDDESRAEARGKRKAIKGAKAAARLMAAASSAGEPADEGVGATASPRELAQPADEGGTTPTGATSG